MTCALKERLERSLPILGKGLLSSHWATYKEILFWVQSKQIFFVK